jgi:two-component system phosphate regulon sensor histidine kinase PhoR
MLASWSFQARLLSEGTLLAMGLGILAIVARRISRDLRALSEAASALGQGRAARSLPSGRDDEIGDLARTLEGMGKRLRETIREVTEERNRLEAILEAMGDGVLVTDGEGRVVLVNPALRAMIDLPPEPVGRTVLELVRNPDLHDLVMAGLRGETDLSAEILLRRGGEERRVLVRLVRVEKPGRPRGMVAVFHDMSEIRRLEQMRRDFVANVSHELKTPLTAIRGYAETLADAPPEDPIQAKAFLETILRNAERLSALVEDLLELSRIESGQMALHPGPLGVRGVVERLLPSVEPVARRRRVTIEIGIPEAFAPVRADASALETVLANLVENAVKYVPEGGRVEVRARETDGMARIEVADSGPGIAAEHLPRIFERFYRVDPSRSREQGGTGLGLAIVKHLTQALGGQAGVESELGRGSVFYVLLPFAAQGADAA